MAGGLPVSAPTCSVRDARGFNGPCAGLTLEALSSPGLEDSTDTVSGIGNLGSTRMYTMGEERMAGLELIYLHQEPSQFYTSTDTRLTSHDQIAIPTGDRRNPVAVDVPAAQRYLP